MNQVGMRLSDGDVRAMMKEAGVEYNGRIFYEGQYHQGAPAIIRYIAESTSQLAEWAKFGGGIWENDRLIGRV